MMSPVTCTGNWINNCWSHKHGPVKDKTHAPAQGRVNVRAGLTPENKNRFCLSKTFPTNLFLLKEYNTQDRLTPVHHDL